MRRILLALVMILAPGVAHAHGPVATGFSGGGGGSACRTSACAQVTDSNADGDLAPELQAAINSVLWPGGTLTTASDVYLAAPKQGAYNLASRIIICGDTSPPSGSTAPDCTGSTQQLPRIHFIGAWSAAQLVCTMAVSNVVNHAAPCVQIGDAYADASFSRNVPLAFDSPLTLRIATVGTGFDFVAGLWCNGCTGELRADINGNTDGLNWPGFLAVIAGSALHSEIAAVSASPFSLPVVVFDGQQAGSTASVRGSGISLEIGGGVSATAPRWIADGCAYNGVAGECDDLHILPDTSIVSGSSVQSALEITNGANIVVEGSYNASNGTGAKPTVELYVGSSPTIRKVTFKGTCYSSSNNLNSCVRLIGDGDPSFTPLFVFDGKIVSAVAGANADRAGVGCNNNRNTKGLTKILVGPNASAQNTAGGNGNLLNSINVWVRGYEVCDTTGVVQDNRTVRIPAQTLGASPPYCADLMDGTWRSCSDERTRIRHSDWSAVWAQSAQVRLGAAAASTTACNVRLMRNGTDPAGSPEASGNYYPNGFAFTVGGDGLKASGDSIAYNVAEPGAAADYWQIQVTDDYANVGGQEACLTPDYTGWASENDDTTHLTDSTQSFSGLSGKRLVLVGGAGALGVKSISSATSTRITVGSAFSAATHGSNNILRTKYRVVAGAGACVCASEALPAMDVTLNLIQVAQ